MELRSKHAQVLELMNGVVNTSRELGLAHLFTQDEALNGRTMRANGKEFLNFTSCSYLGLELDERLINAAIEATKRYGTQFSSSRSYVSVGLYQELEEKLTRVFQKPLMVAPTVTLGHLSNIPTIVGDEDAVVLDIQVHNCVQTAAELLKIRRVTVDVIRHNRIDLLEERIVELKEKHKRIWYMVDGVYSMFGDLAPMKELYALMNKYEQFYLYVDDSHGMSWTGPRGSGYVMSQVDFHEKLFLTTGLAKSFGTCGGVLIFNDNNTKDLVRNCGRTMIFSGPIQPPVLGASIASANIHLSDEIYAMQNELQEKIKFFIETCNKLDLPLINPSVSPIFFIGVGKAEVGYNMVTRLMNAGFYINLSIFPAVAYKNTGLRMPITRHHTKDDIEKLLNCIAEQLPLALKDCNSSMEEVRNAFAPKRKKVN